MYVPFFGLTQAPFSIAPDPHMLFMSERHREALAHLLYGVGGREGALSGSGGGFVLLTGEIGTGKTTVCRCFLEQIPAHCNVAYIFNPKLTVVELLQSVCEEFRIAPPKYRPLPTVKDYVDPLNAFLLEAHAAGRNNVLIIDEAQNLSADVLEQLRLLTNLETSERKLLQIVLIGQPELRDKLKRPELEQLAQRVIARYHLTALTEAETAQYIGHRLEVSGLKSALPFDRKALRRIHQLAQGVPRRINLLCDRALLGAFASGDAAVSARMVDKAAAEVFDPASQPPALAARRRQGWVLMGLGVLAGAALVVAVVDLVRLARAPAMALVATPASGAVAAGAAVSEPAGSGAAAQASPNQATPAPQPTSSPAATASQPTPPTLLRDENLAWRELGQAWKLSPGEGAACQAFVRQQVRCVSVNTSLALVRQLGRPGIVKLDSRTVAPSYALLTTLTADSATLRAGGTEQTVTLAALAGRWQGDFSTLWRTPPGYTGPVADGQGGPVIEWVAARLASWEGTAPPTGKPVQNAAFRERLKAFQLAQGLPVDGLLGPMTFMQLNRLAGVDEPVLRTEP
ncbi:AAA family ATPase [Polaromonas sp.]|jgi:general secretion pathway protein A|uniref:ExeA family protein n=1 Tax=Polaromonas sp. TaxID=1869339 RepID=UPI002CE49EFD|nr:AAA family ATPase [Polaromonas sp.]HQS32415.1 AAA family ATPase [Polaromonas sp.]HQS90994.1 AAA family ATPase [Polaromonas sp.]